MDKLKRMDRFDWSALFLLLEDAPKTKDAVYGRWIEALAELKDKVENNET